MTTREMIDLVPLFLTGMSLVLVIIWIRGHRDHQTAGLSLVVWLSLLAVMMFWGYGRESVYDVVIEEGFVAPDRVKMLLNGRDVIVSSSLEIEHPFVICLGLSGMDIMFGSPFQRMESTELILPVRRGGHIVPGSGG